MSKSDVIGTIICIFILVSLICLMVLVNIQLGGRV